MRRPSPLILGVVVVSVCTLIGIASFMSSWEGDLGAGSAVSSVFSGGDLERLLAVPDGEEANDLSERSKFYFEAKQLIKTRDAQLENKEAHEPQEIEDDENEEGGIHVVFSTECHAFHDWQSAALLHSHRRLNHPGKITRLVNCNYDPKYTSDYGKFSYHWAGPAVSPLNTTGDAYPPYNRPAAIMHWLKHSKHIWGTIIVVIDPDEILVHPYSFPNVKIGRGAGQRYEMGYYWMNLLDPHCEGKCSRISLKEAHDNYNVGPPYVLHIHDLHKMIQLWWDLTVLFRNTQEVVKETGWVTEMYAYMVAAVRNDIPHDVTSDLMVSNVHVNDGEAWRLVDFDNVPERTAPANLHYCQKYVYQHWSFGKHDLHNYQALECFVPFTPLPELPEEEWAIARRDPDVKVRRNAWMLHTIVPILNNAFRSHRDTHCDASAAPVKVQVTDSQLSEKDRRKLEREKEKAEAEEELQREIDEMNAEPEEGGIHIVFSTECHAFHDWQSAALLHSHRKLKHPGRITRLVSCDYDPKYVERYPRFSYHWAPQANPLNTTRDEYAPYNRPASLMHWLQHSKHIWGTTIVVIDPDEILVHQYSFPNIRPGRGAGQRYALGTAWRHWAAPHCDGKCEALTDQTADDNYNVGPPYVLHIKDLHKMMRLWWDLTVLFRNTPHIVETSGWVTEMYAYMVAAVRNDIPHDITNNLMVSNVHVDYGEAWELVDFENVPETTAPANLHYCQKYEYKQWEFGKHDHHNFFPLKCKDQDGLLPELPMEEWEIARHSSDVRLRRNAWMLKTVVPLLNGAFVEYRKEHCPEEDEE